MDPSMIMSILGGLGGMFSGPQSPEVDPRMQAIFKQLMNTSRQARNYGKGVPGSDSQEQAAMAQAMGLMGTQQNAGAQQMMGMLTPADGSSGAMGDFMKNLNSSNQMQTAGLTQSMMMDFLGKRQQARYSTAPGLASQAMGAASNIYRPAQPTGWEGLSPMLSQLAYSMSRRQGAGYGDDYEDEGGSDLEDLAGITGRARPMGTAYRSVQRTPLPFDYRNG